MNETLTMRKNAGDDDAARSALTGALIGLARVAEGLEDMPHEAPLLLKGLRLLDDAGLDAASAQAMTDRIHEEKSRLAPNCAHCAAPCGRNDDYDLTQLSLSSAAVRAVKERILSGLYQVAADARNAEESPSPDAALNRLLILSLLAVGEDWTEEKLQSVLEKVNQFCA